MTVLAVIRRLNQLGFWKVKIELTGHPPHSSDLAPNDFYLFTSVKNKLRGQRFRAAKRPLMSSLSRQLARLRNAFGDEAPCKATVYNLFAEFKRCYVNLSVEVRDGRSSTATNDKNCAPYGRNR
ncbi:hypothetical protein EVAR_92481_1 [Eumeta japonica]|uniref:Mariner Mos1 transposase n=1 Tax=Eumeta variegata TaxID=151549 RepID=A0A4C1T953_EUMVA|nr:hypothetical protein EVAR_92481_1 [Eumeta japonica]